MFTSDALLTIWLRFAEERQASDQLARCATYAQAHESSLPDWYPLESAGFVFDTPLAQGAATLRGLFAAGVSPASIRVGSKRAADATSDPVARLFAVANARAIPIEWDMALK